MICTLFEGDERSRSLDEVYVNDLQQIHKHTMQHIHTPTHVALHICIYIYTVFKITHLDEDRLDGSHLRLVYTN
jgi:hypothetical protein